MTLERRLIRRIVLLGAFAMGTFAPGTFAVISAQEAAPTPSPALVITARGARELEILDPLTRKVVGRVSVGDQYPHEVAVSPDGKLAFVTCNNRGLSTRTKTMVPAQDYIVVVDLVAQKELRQVETGLGSFPHGIRFADGKLYFTDQGYQAIGRYDPASNQIDWMLGVAQGRDHMLVVTKDAQRIFTTNTFFDTVSEIAPWVVDRNYHSDIDEDPPAFKVTNIAVGKSPEGIAMSPDEKEVWVLNRSNGGSVSIIDVASQKLSQTLRLSGTQSPIRLAFTPDGKRVIVADGLNGTILMLDAKTRTVTKQLNLGKTEAYQLVDGVPMRNGKRIYTKYHMHGVLVSPDGSHAYVGVLGDNEIAVIDLKKFKVTGSIPTGKEPEGMAWTERQ